jgi:ferredoxin/flavodoxin---NADP+ reductase
MARPASVSPPYGRGVVAGFDVLENTRLSAGVHRLRVRAARIAETRRPGQFVIVRLGPGAERIPLTIADADAADGTITLVIQVAGKSTGDLVRLRPGEAILDVAGPLGRPTELVAGGAAVCVGGGVGTAVLLPIVGGLVDAGTRVTVIIGARSAPQMILEDELRALAGAVVVCTEDGSCGRAGVVTDALAAVLASAPPDAVYAVGPVRMMQAVAELTRPCGVRTIVSLNPIMVDGTGMCGGCRCTVDGTMRFACVDGPEFDGHAVDFDELADRLTTYAASEHEAVVRVGPVP